MIIFVLIICFVIRLHHVFDIIRQMRLVVWTLPDLHNSVIIRVLDVRNMQYPVSNRLVNEGKRK